MLKELTNIFNETVYDLMKINEKDFKDHMIQELKQMQKEMHKKELRYKLRLLQQLMKLWITLPQSMRSSLISLTLVHCKTMKNQQSPMHKRLIRLFIQVNLNLRPSRLTPQMKPLQWKKEMFDVMVVYSSNFGVTPFNYVDPSALTKRHTKEMISQVMQTYVE